LNYYNEFDPDAAQWLRNLITAGLIPDGDVDERSIEDVTPNDLAGYTQCHFFAGLGGWIYAIDLAGWPRDRPVWPGGSTPASMRFCSHCAQYWSISFT
jgi:DNA (cytosine-5)-methyltransferase 1